MLSTISITIEKHFCGNTLIDIALFTEADKCGMEIPYNQQDETSLIKSCCKDVVDVIEGQDKLNFNSSKDFKLSNNTFAAIFTYSYLNLYEELPNQIIHHKNYRPPNLIFDRQVLDQVFLI
ncbi:MAG: hypothetical protein HKO92_09295 [Flavobacteriaceae bacterium]|nr:hypothetical protein [Bacteroidia bacterium]NNK83306.1 hypothetical protein [Flavobacteriaceae bacterium]